MAQGTAFPPQRSKGEMLPNWGTLPVQQECRATETAAHGRFAPSS